MILNNFWTLKGYVDANSCPCVGSSTVNLGLKRKSDGVSMPFANDLTLNIAGLLSTNYTIRKGLKVFVGSGTTEPTTNDYALENDVTNSFSNVVTTCNTSTEESKITTVVTISGTNTTENAITIAEIGVGKDIAYDWNGANLRTQEVLFIRHVLDTPKVVESGEGFMQTFAWDEQ